MLYNIYVSYILYIRELHIYILYMHTLVSTAKTGFRRRTRPDAGEQETDGNRTLSAPFSLFPSVSVVRARARMFVCAFLCVCVFLCARVACSSMAWNRPSEMRAQSIT